MTIQREVIKNEAQVVFPLSLIRTLNLYLYFDINQAYDLFQNFQK